LTALDRIRKLPPLMRHGPQHLAVAERIDAP